MASSCSRCGNATSTGPSCAACAGASKRLGALFVFEAGGRDWVLWKDILAVAGVSLVLACLAWAVTRHAHAMARGAVAGLATVSIATVERWHRRRRLPDFERLLPVVACLAVAVPLLTGRFPIRMVALDTLLYGACLVGVHRSRTEAWLLDWRRLAAVPAGVAVLRWLMFSTNPFAGFVEAFAVLGGTAYLLDSPGVVAARPWWPLPGPRFQGPARALSWLVLAALAGAAASAGR